MPKKIFEMAKELEIGALELVEELKELGFAVRNHMSALDDEQAAQAILKFKEKRGLLETEKKTTKKKVTKKKKKVTKKKATSEEGEATEKPAAKKKASVVKRKAVVRKRADSKKEAAPEEAPQVVEEKVTEKIVEEKVSAPATPKTEPAKEASKKDEGGLRVVFDPKTEPKKEEAPAPKKEAKSEKNSKNKEYLEEKMHTFTPVYVPKEGEKKEAKEKPKSSTDKPKAPAKATPADAQAAADKGATEKKRLGGLAQMVTKGKAPVKRDMTQIRADEELKKYGTGVVGKVAYSPVGRKRVYSGPTQSTIITEVKDSKKFINLHDGGTAREVAQKLSTKFANFADKALELGVLLKEDDYLGMDLAGKLAALYGYRVENKAFDEAAILNAEAPKKKSDEPTRNPCIAIMGHVDHGKTTLLDHIRNSKVVAGEAGGITQHIGAYRVKTSKANLTFLDTPGHAAFGAMRQRGADITDIVILVVAADDGVMPQTKESIKFCKNAGVPIIVAVNKMDKEGANPDRVKQELMEFELTPEEWGGETQYCPISALKGDGIDDLLEAVGLQAEMMELTASPKGAAEGVVIESKIETGRGPVATVLVQKGTLKKGDAIVVGETFGRARSLMDEHGNNLKSAGPSEPVQILGLQEAASPGDSVNSVKNEREAKKICENRINERKELDKVEKKETISLEDFFATAAPTEEKKVMNLIIRSDVKGSYEAIKNAVEGLGNEEVGVKVIGGGVGAITDNDVNLASSSGGFIIGFNMRPVTTARRLAEQEGVDVKTYSIIYELINDVKLALEGMLSPETVEIYIGRAEVRETFSIPKIGLIAGSSVIDGKIKKGCNIRLLRQGKIVFDGKMSSLKRFKDDAKEVTAGYECGIGLDHFTDVRKEDIFEAYMVEEKQRKLEDNDQVL